METSDKKKMMPSEEKVWQKYYPPSAKELLEKKMPEQTLWQYVSEAIWEQGDKYDAFVYFGRHIKRSTFLAEVEKWARVLRGMGLGVGDQVLLFSPAVPEAFYVLFAADCIGVTTISAAQDNRRTGQLGEDLQSASQSFQVSDDESGFKTLWWVCWSY